MTTASHIVPDHKLAGALSSCILLRDVAFMHVNAQVTGAVEDGTLSYELQKVIVEWSRRDNDVIAILPFGLTAVATPSVEATSSNESIEPVKVAELSVTMRLRYSLVEANGTVAPNQIPHVLGTLGYMHAWPYFRADVQWLTTKLGFPALVMPVVLSSQVPERVLVSELPIDDGMQEAVPPKRKRKPSSNKGSRSRTT
jgi:hypothetical protein